jgi:inorganic pyrophosphatase
MPNFGKQGEILNEQEEKLAELFVQCFVKLIQEKNPNVTEGYLNDLLYGDDDARKKAYRKLALVFHSDRIKGSFPELNSSQQTALAQLIISTNQYREAEKEVPEAEDEEDEAASLLILKAAQHAIKCELDPAFAAQAEAKAQAETEAEARAEAAVQAEAAARAKATAKSGAGAKPGAEARTRAGTGAKTKAAERAEAAAKARAEAQERSRIDKEKAAARAQALARQAEERAKARAQKRANEVAEKTEPSARRTVATAEAKAREAIERARASAEKLAKQAEARANTEEQKLKVKLAEAPKILGSLQEKLAQIARDPIIQPSGSTFKIGVSTLQSKLDLLRESVSALNRETVVKKQDAKRALEGLKQLSTEVSTLDKTVAKINDLQKIIKALMKENDQYTTQYDEGSGKKTKRGGMLLLANTNKKHTNAISLRTKLAQLLAAGTDDPKQLKELVKTHLELDKKAMGLLSNTKSSKVNEMLKNAGKSLEEFDKKYQTSTPDVDSSSPDPTRSRFR